jgi:two-component system cell cycle sensor histidine kinase PleC
MAKTDAWGAPGGSVFVRRSPERMSGRAVGIAEPAYHRLLAAEPLLRRSIPVLIFIFLAVIAAVRILALHAHHDEIERNARTILSLAAGDLLSEVERHRAEAGSIEDAGEDMLARTVGRALLGTRHIAAITDSRFVVTAAFPAAEWVGKRLDAVISGGQPLFLFGKRAGTMEVSMDGAPWLVAVDIAGDREASAVVLVLSSPTGGAPSPST